MTLVTIGTSTARLGAQTALPFGWLGPDCPEQASIFERRLLELLDPHERTRLNGTVAVKEGATGHGVELTVALDGRALGLRRFEAVSCAAAAETAAVAASLAVYEGEGPPPPVAVQTGIVPDIWTRRPDPTPDFSSPVPPARAVAPPSLHARLGLFVQGELGTLPKLNSGGALAVDLVVRPRWALSLLGSIGREQERALTAPRAVYIFTFGLAARACGAPLLGPSHRLDACLGARWQRAVGRGDGFDIDRSASLDWVGPLAALGFSVQKPARLEWRTELEGTLPLARRSFVVDEEEVARPAAVVGAVRFGALVRF